MSPNLAVYWVSGSPFARRVLVAVEEKGLPYESKLLEASKGEHKTPEYLAINPRGQIPSLVDGKRTVCESLGALLYLDDAYPDKPLRPSSMDDRAVMYQRLFELESLAKAGSTALVFKFRDSIKTKEDEEKYAEACKALKVELDRWEEYLAGDYLAGDSFTMADLSLGVALAQFERSGLDLSKFPKMQAYWNKIKVRPSFEATIPPHWKSSEAKDWLKCVTEQ